MDRGEQTRLILLEIIRERSANAQLAEFDELLAELSVKGLLNSETGLQKDQLQEALSRLVAENGDIKEISGRNRNIHYYSSLSVSDMYAGILALKGESSLIADIVRENSATYPRPVPLAAFTEHPFDLSIEEILECLKTMEKQEDFEDIAQTSTSIGTVFLYSKHHLDPTYASTLAEWIDVGEADNP